MEKTTVAGAPTKRQGASLRSAGLKRDRTITSSERTDDYTRIANQIVATIERGTGEFRMPWHHDGRAASNPTNVASAKHYRGVNVLALWVAAFEACYPTGIWGTYRQWQALGAQVRKDERGSLVVFWKVYGDNETEEHDEDLRQWPAQR